MARSRTLCTVVGARPQFVKAAVVSRALREAGVAERLVHTGQHYDAGMSQVFFDELGVPAPEVNLGVGSGTHAVQTGAMMTRLEAYLQERPDVGAVLVYGDTNSTLAGALVAAKLHLPVIHVEAGLRSFDRRMPEEVNRVVTDRISTLLLAPTATAVANLRTEGITAGVTHIGDVMLDATRHFGAWAAERYPIGQLTSYEPGAYYLATIHRAANTDAPARLQRLLDGLGRLGGPVLWPVHPRTRERLVERCLPSNLELRDPVGYLQMLTLVQHARRILTDSGGLQKEAYWLGVPCVTLRPTTEWVETLDGGWNHLVDADPRALVRAARAEPQKPRAPLGAGPTGTPSTHAAALIADVLATPVPADA